MSEPKFEHTGAYCRDNGGGYDPDCWACDPSHFATLTAEVERLKALVTCPVCTHGPECVSTPYICEGCWHERQAEVERLTRERDALLARNENQRTEVARLQKEAVSLQARVAELEAALERTQMVLKALHAGLSSHPNSAHSILCGAANSRPCAVIDQMADNYAALAPQEPE